MKIQTLQLKAVCQKAADGGLRVIASDESIDRSGESIPFESWDLSKFIKSPRLLIDHDYSVKSIVGRGEQMVKNSETRSIEFTPVFHDITQAARDTKEMVDQGFLDTVSVGFLRGQGAKGAVINELMEVSFVAVPANSNARVLSVKDITADEESAVETFVKGEEKATAEGDPCQMEDGSEGTMQADDTGTLVCMMKKVEEEKEVKGAIADTITAEDMMDQKCDNLSEAWEIVYALCDVYCKPETPVEAWGALVTEAGNMIVALAADPTAGEPASESATEGLVSTHMKTDEAKKSFAEKKEKVFIVEKSGRVLSQKNRGIISIAKDAMSSSIVALEELLKAADAEEITSEGDGEVKTVDSTSEKKREQTSYQKFIELRKILRAVNAGLSDGLAIAKLTK